MYHKFFTTGLLLTFMGCVQSCQKEEVVTQAPQLINANKTNSEINQLQITFAKALAKAVSADPAIRVFIRSEAIKQFDKDYDVLYHMVKDQPIQNGKTLHERLLQYVAAEDLDNLERKLPLLTVFVPTLPSQFSAQTWETTNQIPSIAVAKIGEHDVPLYDADGKEEVVPAGRIPSKPVIVIKQNERLAVNSISNITNRNTSATSTLQTNSFSFSFKDKSFDGIHSDAASRQAVVAADGRDAGHPIDPRAIEAFNSGAEWHRDYVYYGITPSVPKGALKRNYRETIRAMKFSPDAFVKMSDQGIDPRTTGATSPTGSFWTEGFFELKVIPIINARNGLGSDLQRIITVRAQDLYEIQYKQDGNYYLVDKLIPKEFHPDIDIVTWDLQNYGSAWKIVFYEEDSNDTQTQTMQLTTTYALNFEVNASGGIGEIVKVGGKFGGSFGQTDTKTISYQTTLGSDYLGEVAVFFEQPIILSQQIRPAQGTVFGIYNTYENTTGGSYSMLSVSIEPMRYY